MMRSMNERILDNEARYRLLRLLAETPNLSQRELARELDVSLGKLNYCLKALLDVGYVKARNFKNSEMKQAYLYKLTPEGIAAKAAATVRFLGLKQREFERLAEEIAVLRREADNYRQVKR